MMELRPWCERLGMVSWWLRGDILCKMVRVGKKAVAQVLREAYQRFRPREGLAVMVLTLNGCLI